MNIGYLDKDKRQIDGVRNIWRDEDANEVKRAVNSKLDKDIIELTYQELKVLKQRNQLIPNQIYRFLFKLIHLIQDTERINNESIAEYFLIQAVSVNSFRGTVISESYPLDKIEYNFDLSIAEDGLTQRPGYVTYREDTVKRIIAYYDWRNVRFRLYETTLVHYPVEKVNEGYVRATVGGTPTIYLYNEHYIDFNNFLTHNAAPQLRLTRGNNSYQRELVKENGSSLAANEINILLGSSKYARVYFSKLFDKWIIADNQIESDDCKGEYGISTDVEYIGDGTRLKPSLNDYIDVLTFSSTDPNAYDVYIGKNYDNLPNRIVFLNDNVRDVKFYGSYCRDIIFKGTVSQFTSYHDLFRARFIGQITYCTFYSPASSIYISSKRRLSFSFGTSGISYFEKFNGLSIFSRGNFNISINRAQDSTFRLTGIGNNFNMPFRLDTINRCVFNFYTKSIGNVFQSGFISQKYFIECGINNTNWIAGYDDTIKVFEQESGYENMIIFNAGKAVIKESVSTHETIEINLPTSPPEESNRLWKDENGFVKST
jgi:hypothetical protein